MHPGEFPFARVCVPTLPPSPSPPSLLPFDCTQPWMPFIHSQRFAPFGTCRVTTSENCVAQTCSSACAASLLLLFCLPLCFLVFAPFASLVCFRCGTNRWCPGLLLLLLLPLFFFFVFWFVSSLFVSASQVRTSSVPSVALLSPCVHQMVKGGGSCLLPFAVFFACDTQRRGQGRGRDEGRKEGHVRRDT